MTIVFKETKQIDQKNLLVLYEDVEWYAYTKDINQLEQAISNSLYVLSAWDEECLIGLIRIIGDGLTIIYIQDILVLNSYQNHGIATKLMDRILDKFKAVRQKVLLTEEAPNVRHFYEKNGFDSCNKGTLVAFVKLT
ncbi:GNAT family N-acetyltransferase [Planococcus kocurii]|uniref:GNAT family N-acetyltransferase n=1 Tax=Planococcus TaxID=1372 RepID=UPI0011EDAD75|nr:GNAT family N-acetyltransferase [Planococcus sp. ANT_H30]KAA0956363.1 GNAT family N-acetyltransferase [Planococcus sp. ANT_H30]